MCRLQQNYKYSPDEFLCSVAPKVRSGKWEPWNAEKVLEDAERDLICVRNNLFVFPDKRADIGHGLGDLS